MATEDLLRELAPQVLGALVRHYGHFDEAEEAVQEALITAATQWPERGEPDNPRGWLITVASRRLIDELRSAEARRQREEKEAVEVTTDPGGQPDDELLLLFLCCHESLTAASQMALTLRAVGGLTTTEIAGAFLVPESTMAQRISRAKRSIRDAGGGFDLPDPEVRAARLGTVLHILYLIFNEGYATSTGDTLVRTELSAEAIRLTRQVHAMLPDDPEITGLLALMLLTDARRDARTGPDGALVPLEQQDRERWDRDQIDEGVELISRALPAGPVGPYQLQAAIAAVHDEADKAEETDWPQILALYRMLSEVAPGPMISLNLAIAQAMVEGPEAGLEALRPLADDPHLRSHHRLFAARAHLLELIGNREDARRTYVEAAELATSGPEQRYLLDRSERLA